MQETIITVAGSSRLRRNPERARVRIGIGFEGSKRDSVLAATRAAHESLTGSLETLLDEQHGPVIVWSSEEIRVWGQRPWSQDGTRLPVEFHSAVFVDAEFDDFEALSEWIDVVAIREGIAIDGIDWLLSPETEHEVQSEARRSAVVDALEKAHEYAEALGLGEVRALAVADPGLLESSAIAPLGAPEMMALGRAMPAAGGGGMELRPSAIAVEATVHIRFAASPAAAL
ncbi:SIMPL domain-containing protein [Herbiconiux sp. CPCC 203407]|uniref:SIMPL domain-containing protein n=1 Tax=Herbiconiux oxytropis TaxID=2970915 RepID=A0AA41XH97_9MICO|nr:SIMPL domain-containing protein [Herbiconiux oxytropis]MCS5721336.1 SIMPL domain-containing protein [Herbiconiux oxytropis]MCS5726225.1 SIMPL domain-containing protein [Herbiconiux oxytropis]